MRRFGSPPEPGRHYTDRPGAYGIILTKGGLLLTEQAEPGPEVQLPGGGIDPGEHMLPALMREIYEETGWRAAPLRVLGWYQRYTYMPEYDLYARKLCHIVLCRAAYALGPPSEAGHRALVLPPLEAVGVLGSPGDAAWVARTFGLRA
ncbi:MAG: NUDIX domain-containing protein [Pseudomonadota bacterium]